MKPVKLSVKQLRNLIFEVKSTSQGRIRYSDGAAALYFSFRPKGSDEEVDDEGIAMDFCDTPGEMARALRDAADWLDAHQNEDMVGVLDI